MVYADLLFVFFRIENAVDVKNPTKNATIMMRIKGISKLKNKNLTWTFATF